ncbi:MAG: Transcriptional activator CadC [Stenotrophomonas maltophilia]|uniref:Transcriptional activator CadC n=1 Tax=Stenotrophomonas maltophilia TaxID=40324 RepID=A0A7V8FFM3_STEMA|nr:MAG: Transcriptional activator CadC [Stenotrophomonas maltophilia]
MNSSEFPPPGADQVMVGQCRVSLSSREVQVPGMRRLRRLTPKALAVLRVLMRQPGRVVTRDELFAEVWPDTLPTNDVLTQEVTQLRKVFAVDEDAGTAYIETIVKSGYRLLVPVTVLDEAPVISAEPDTQDTPAPRRTRPLRPLPRRSRRRARTCPGGGAACARRCWRPPVPACWWRCW